MRASAEASAHARSLARARVRSSTADSAFAAVDLGRTDGDDVREHFDPDRAQELAAHGPDGGSRRRLARACALEDVA